MCSFSLTLKQRASKIKKTKILIVIFLFFPFDYWEKHIETKKCKDPYGSYTYFLKFKKFWEDVNNRLTSVYKDKKIHFIIEPYIRFKGEVGEQATMFFLDPEGKALEFKSFKNMDDLFRK